MGESTKCSPPGAGAFHRFETRPRHPKDKESKTRRVSLGTHNTLSGGRAGSRPFLLALDPGPQGRATSAGPGQGWARADPEPLNFFPNAVIFEDSLVDFYVFGE